MKKYIILNGDNKSGIACFDENQKKMTINIDGYKKLEKGEYFAICADGVCIGKTIGGKCAFKLEKFDGGIEIMRRKTGTDREVTEYTSEANDKANDETKNETTGDAKSSEDTEKLSEKNFKWQKVRGYYCIKNLEIAKYVMGGENVYSAINKKGYYLFGETDKYFAVAVPSINKKSPFTAEIDRFAEKSRILGDDYYVVLMGTDENGEFFLKPAK